ncbi:cupin domain-containing protein [Rhodoferax sp.]|uniref:cupin domain-containing protein n=1 Tax=Rhodoferax sp. TaxID=50421 RepID=UPI002635E96F|nr:cupin domain-containing protein [Rhodoferax sp.]MDD5478882.1 cupin domain-containing protein [Rhodoferax sp.]
MLTLNLADFSLEHFMACYWQQQPLVIRQGFQDFEDPINANDLAGLAMEEAVQSRLIFKKGDKWQAESGPFESYKRFGKTDWSLVVQAVNHYSPEVAELVKPFAFIPKWRFDDVMVSYATPGGGVGPHIDLYDVFICQGSGRRRWRVGDIGNHKQFAAHAALLHTEPFEAIIDVELLPGDILYIPPGFPHDGVTLESSLSFSVGFRAKSGCDMLSGLADHVIDKDLGKTLLADPKRPIAHQQGRIDTSDLTLIRANIQNLLDNEALMADFAGSYFSATKCALDLQALDDPLDTADMLAQLQDQPLIRTGGLRCFYVDATIDQGVCYVDGERYAFGADLAASLMALCDHDEITANLLAPALNHPEFARQLTDWVNAGYWYFND